MEEVESGNREFTAALAQQKADLAAMHSPEADYFIAVSYTHLIRGMIIARIPSFIAVSLSR